MIQSMVDLRRWAFLWQILNFSSFLHAHPCEHYLANFFQLETNQLFMKMWRELVVACSFLSLRLCTASKFRNRIIFFAIAPIAQFPTKLLFFFFKIIPLSTQATSHELVDANTDGCSICFETVSEDQQPISTCSTCSRQFHMTVSETISKYQLFETFSKYQH